MPESVADAGPVWTHSARVRRGDRAGDCELGMIRNAPEGLVKYEYSVLELCEIVHMSKTGAGDKLYGEELGKCTAALMKRLSSWVKGTDGSKNYDDAVKALIVATLKEQLED